jgi:copper resistance protein D
VGNEITIWAIIRWLHLLSAMAWIGGMIVIVVVLLPIVRATVPAEERTLIVAEVGRRYATLSWIALTILVVTGYLNTERRGLVWSRMLESDYGETLHNKLTLVGFVIILMFVQAFYVGRRIERLAKQSRTLATAGATEARTEVDRERQRLQRLSGILSGVTLLLNLVIVLLAASLIA